MTRRLGRVVTNSGPIIGLSKLNLLYLLWDIFEEVYVVQSVYDEITIQGRNKTGATELQNAVEKGNIIIYSAKDELFVKRFLGRLHRGELETIAASKELNTEYILIDDKSARSLAEALLLKPSGLLSILKIAKISGKIDSMKYYLDQLIEKKYYISKNLYNEMLKDVCEI